MASPASFGKGTPIPGPKNPGTPNMFIQPVVPGKRKPRQPKISKKPDMTIQPMPVAGKYSPIKSTKQVNKIYKTY